MKSLIPLSFALCLTLVSLAPAQELVGLFLPHILYRREVNELYLQTSYLRGLNHGWEHAFMADLGYRFMIWRGLNLRMGVAVLAAPDRKVHVNPTPGAGWSYVW